MTFHIIGIGNKLPVLTKTQQELILKTTIFSGGKRHYELVKSKLPKAHQWVPIQSPMDAVYRAYEQASTPIVIFASGNPLFYGFSNTLQHKYPNATLHTTPYFSAIQLLANATNTNSNLLQTVSVHGRAWSALDAILIQQKELIGVLTDPEKTPATITKRMLDFGYSNYDICIGEDIEGTQEQFHELSLAAASKMEFHSLNCILLKKKHHRPIDFGIADTHFKSLPGRPNMITKMPIRLTTLHLLNVLQSTILWDIGFCTGAVSIEAKLKNPNLEVIAFEKRPECEAIIMENQKRFGVPGIQSIMGDFFDQELTSFPKPDTVFIGGHGGQLKKLLRYLKPIVQQNTTIVINAVKEDSIKDFKEGCAAIGYAITETLTMTIDTHNSIMLLQAKKEPHFMKS